MKRKSKKYLYAMTAFTSLMTAPGAMAHISPNAFKNVTRHFKTGKEYCSPVLGEVALESGLIHNLRFYGNLETNNDAHIKDSPKDGLSSLVKTFFPSPAGHLATETNAKDNFARHVKNPETVALLLNFSQDYRAYRERQKEISSEKGNIDKETLIMKDLQKDIANLRKIIKDKNKEKETLKKGNFPPEQRKEGLEKLESENRTLTEELKRKEVEKKEVGERIKSVNAFVHQKEQKEKDLFKQKKASLREKMIKSLDLSDLSEEEKQNFIAN